MNREVLKTYLKKFLKKYNSNKLKFEEECNERVSLIHYYQGYKKNKILSMNKEQIYEYLAKLWAMRIWGNKHYVVNKIIGENGLANFKKQLADLLWGNNDIAKRWDAFRKNIKGMGPAMISEILCKTHPDKYMLWNRRAYIGLNCLEVKSLPRHDYQITGEVYKNLCEVCKDIAQELNFFGFKDKTLLAVDYFIWNELQAEESLAKTCTIKQKPKNKEKKKEQEVSEFVHNDIRDKLRDIGQWLGFISTIEQLVAKGSRVDTIWESTIGNMGRIIYAFEVQTKGSIDGLIVNLLKCLNNPAVQGVVAVSDCQQLDKIKDHISGVKDLRDKVRYWDYEDVAKVHESLEFVNENINNLGLVPEGF